ncbi:MAG: EAL domain-containing protein [Cyanobacteriota bacterium]
MAQPARPSRRLSRPCRQPLGLGSWLKEERAVLGRHGPSIAALVVVGILAPLLALQARERLRETCERLITERREPRAVVVSAFLNLSRVARDWAKWSEMLNFVLHNDPGFVPTNVEPASVLENGAVMAVVRDDGRLLFSRGSDGRERPLHLSLLACASPNLASLRDRRAVRMLACRSGGVDYIGVATRVTDSAISVAAPAVLLFFAPLQNPELGPGLNAQLRRLAKDFLWLRPADPAHSSSSLNSMGLPAPVHGAEGRQLVLRRVAYQPQALGLVARDLAVVVLLLSLVLGLRRAAMLQRRRTRLVQRQLERRGNGHLRRLGSELEAMLDGTHITALTASRSDQVMARLMLAPAAIPSADLAPPAGAASALNFEARLQRLTGRFQAVLARARSLALLDPLTGLPNRRYFIEHLQLELERWRGQLAPGAGSAGAAAGETVLPFGVILIDVDRFKIINDSYGHRTGDAVLKAVATRLQDSLAPSDLLARYGADELAIWVELSDQPEPSQQALLQELRERSNALLAAFRTPLNLDAIELTVGVSLGVHLLTSAQDDGSEALKCANLALVRAKARPHSTAVLYDSEQDVSELTSYQLYLDLIEAIRDGGQQLQVLFQPIFAPSGRVQAVEALARWTHPSLGPIPPDRFLALAAQHRVIVPLGEVLQRLSLDGFQTIQARDPAIRLALNLHPNQLSDPFLVRRLLEQLQLRGLPPGRLTAELTEQALLEQEPTVQTNLQLLRQYGIALSLDDFGTGYSSLVMLGNLRPDEVKIDRSFAQSMLSDPYAVQVVSMITGMALSLELDLVAEGVDSPEVLQALARLGVRRFQGYLLGRPMTAAELVERLAGRGFGFPAASVPAEVAEG